MSDKNLFQLLKKERQAFIMKQINLHNRVISADLSVQLNVSEDTIRRDLNELAEEGKITKVHGGALSKSYIQPTTTVDVYAHEAKEVIAQKAVSLLRNGMCVLTGGGTTIRSLTKMIPEELRMTFFTISPQTALDLIAFPNLEVILIGGQVSPQTQICMGGETIHRLSEIRVDLCLMGTNGIDASAGLTEQEWEVAQVKKAMMKAAEKTATLSISEKFGSMYRMKYCNIHDLDYLITELPPEDMALAPYRKNGLHLL
ncbi:MAG: DeoR/GlpR family DNA-binding transcription regulator [Spirosomataceae bacterium]